jgi:hypothetical protein
MIIATNGNAQYTHGPRFPADTEEEAYVLLKFIPQKKNQYN